MGRAPCCTKVGLKRGPWTAEEDTLLTKYIEEHGEGNWRNLPKGAGLLRCGKSCRLRWINYLRPDVKRGNISEDEEELIIKLHSLLGNRWALIAGRIPGRTDNEIKNYWNTHLRKKLASKDMNPNTQKPIHLGFHTVLRDSGSNDCSTPKCCSSEKKLPQLKTESEDNTNESNLSTQDKSDHHGASHLPLCSSVSSECHDTDILSSRSRSNNADTITSQSSAVSASSAMSVSDSFPACLPEHSDFSCLEPLVLPSIACMDYELSSGANFSSDSIGSFNAPLPSSDEDTPISVGLYCNNINKVLGFDYAGDNSILTAFFPAANELTSLEQLQNLDFLQEDVEVDNFGDSINWVAANSWELF